MALVVGGIGVLRLRSGKSGAGLLKLTMVIALVLAVAYVVAVWAMTGKPTGASAAPAVGPVQTPDDDRRDRHRHRVQVHALEVRVSRTARSSSRSSNKGKIAHDFSIDGKTSTLVSPGKSARLTVRLAPASSSTSAPSRATHKQE